LNEFLANRAALDGKKVAVVCHSKLISALTASGVEGKGAQSKLIDFTWTQNCEICPFTP